MPASDFPLDAGFDVLLVILLTGLGLRVTKNLFSERSLASVLMASGVGFFFFIGFIFTVTQLGLLTFKVVGIAMLVIAMIGWSPLSDLAHSYHPSRIKTYFRENPLSTFEWALLSLLIGAAIFNLLFNYAPPTGEDELHYHISLPALFSYAGKWVQTPGVFSSFFPLNGELLYTGVLVMRQVPAVKAMVWLSGLLLALSQYVLGRRYILLGRREAILAVTLLYTSPMLTSYNGTTSVDMLNMFYVIVTAFAFWEWKAEKDWKRLLLMGVLAGTGMGTRLYAAPWILAFCIVIAFVERRPRDALVLGAIAAALYAPWWIRNYLLKGNPFYPGALWKGAVTDVYQMGMQPHSGNLRTWLKLPFFLSTGMFIWGMGLLPWSLVPFAALQRSGRRRLAYAALFGALTLTLLHLVPGVEGIARYYAAAFPWIALLAAAGFGAIMEHRSTKVRALAQGWVLCLLFFPNAALSAYFGAQRIPFFLGRQSEGDYLRLHYPGHEGYDMFAYLREHLPLTESVLRFGDLPNTSAVYYPGHRITTMALYPPPFYNRATSAELAQALKEKGIDDILFQRNSFTRQPDRSWLFSEFVGITLHLPPLERPYFQAIHETPEAVLYRVSVP